MDKQRQNADHLIESRGGPKLNGRHMLCIQKVQGSNPRRFQVVQEKTLV